MYLRVSDGVPIIATKFLRYTAQHINEELELRFQVEQGGVVCYSNDELQEVKNILDQKGIPYQEEALQYSITVDPGIKYNNRTEAVEHFMNGKEPEHVTIKKLMRRVDELERKVNNPRSTQPEGGV